MQGFELNREQPVCLLVTIHGDRGVLLRIGKCEHLCDTFAIVDVTYLQLRVCPCEIEESNALGECGEFLLGNRLLDLAYDLLQLFELSN